MKKDMMEPSDIKALNIDVSSTDSEEQIVNTMMIDMMKPTDIQAVIIDASSTDSEEQIVNTALMDSGEIAIDASSTIPISRSKFTLLVYTSVVK